MSLSSEPKVIDLHGIRIHRVWLQQHLLTIGATGSGKSRGVIQRILLGVLSQGDAAVVIDVKGDLEPMIRQALARCGREADLITLGIGEGDHVFNPLASTVHPHKLANEIIAASAITGGMPSQRLGGDDLFWATARVELLAAIIELALARIAHSAAEPPLTFTHLQRLRQELSQPHAGLQLWAKASAEYMSEAGGTALMEFAAFPDSTRSCVLNSVTNLIGPFVRPPLSLFVHPKSERPSLNIHDVFDKAKVVVVTAAQAENSTELLPGLMLFKTALYRAILARPRLPVRQDTNVMVVVDEYNRLIQAHDIEGSEHVVMEAARSSRVSFVLATQNLSGLEALAGSLIVEKLAALTGNLVFLANSCSTTGRLAERCLGTRRRMERHRSCTTELPPPLLIPESQSGTRRESETTLLVPVIEPRVTTSKLARLKPGEGFVKLVDGSVHKLKCTFD
jgi:type IV secretory pathway TraG/TraD family ATPase VirD4